MKNLFGYDHVLPVPSRIPPGMVSIYVTDTNEVAARAKAAGWQQAVVIDVGNPQTPQGRIDAVTKFSCYPELYLDKTIQHVFLLDANVTVLDSNYFEFVNDAIASDKTLYVTSGWYAGDKNNLTKELGRSVVQSRWKQWHTLMTERTTFYLADLKESGFAEEPPVVSAKYIGWNLQNKALNPWVADRLHSEWKIHIQGNIILSYICCRYTDFVFHYLNFKNDGRVTRHRDGSLVMNVPGRDKLSQ